MRITCATHKNAAALDAMGTCSECGECTTSETFAICWQCAEEANICQFCLSPVS